MEKVFESLSPTDYANVLPRTQFIDFSIYSLLQTPNRIAGPAFTVQLIAGDHLMMHAAIYDAPKGSIIVVDGVDSDFAVAGGNVCAVAQKRGVKGFVVDGVVRDVEEIKENSFPVFAKGVFPVPGSKKVKLPLNQPIVCGGVTVNPGDIIVADSEGIAVIPQDTASEVYEKAKRKADAEQKMSLEEWQANHEHRIKEALLNATAKV
ncbi:RraA family protein [Psychrosphaera sp.]|nr:RraA family protein [Psychrosphaera sp.]